MKKKFYKEITCKECDGTGLYTDGDGHYAQEPITDGIITSEENGSLLLDENHDFDDESWRCPCCMGLGYVTDDVDKSTGVTLRVLQITDIFPL